MSGQVSRGAAGEYQADERAFPSEDDAEQSPLSNYDGRAAISEK